MTEAYPLQWPMSWPRTQTPVPARFNTSLAAGREGLLWELDRMSATNIVISSNMQLRRDGLPYSKQSRLDDTGIAVYFTLNGEQRCIPCDRWDTPEDNLQAIRKTIEALRGLDRWGAKDIVDAAFSGFKALPENVTVTDMPWWLVLHIDPTSSTTEIRKAFVALAKAHHPDVGGDLAEFERIREAYEKAMS